MWYFFIISTLQPWFTFHYGSILICLILKSCFFKFIYIPLWFYSNSVSRGTVSRCWWIYIPLWFYSNQSEHLQNQCRNKIYIPLWFYSNNYWYIRYLDFKRIYIPLWFYSNKVCTISGYCKLTFTFHYGSILIFDVPKSITQWKWFTFHYGSILIFSRFNISRYEANLHSTMVLF